MAVQALVAATVTVGAIAASAAALAPAAAAEPGNPGTPGDPPVVYVEDFENTTSTVPVGIQDYVGGDAAHDAVYTADPTWQAGENCNGWIGTSQMAAPETDPCFAANSSFWAATQAEAIALGQFAGQTPAQAADNHVMAEFTGGPDGSGNPGPGTQLRTTTNNIPAETGHFYMAQASYSVVDYQGGAAGCGTYQQGDPGDPLINLYLFDGTDRMQVGDQLNPCTVPGNTTITVNGVNVRVAQLSSDAMLWTGGSTMGLEQYNANGTGNGNDGATDNIRIIDVTPQLDKSFDPDTVNVGGVSTLTMTVTNTSELAAKDGWSFTDTLPDDLVIAQAPNVGGSCDVTTDAAAGGSTIAVTDGNLDAGEESCTITVDVTSDTAGTYTNDADNITTIVGLDPPGPSTVTFEDSPTWQCDAFGYLFQAESGAPTTSVTKIDLATGQATAAGETSNLVKSVGYNTVDNYIYSLDFQEGRMLRIGSDLSVTDLGPVPGAIGTYNLGDFDNSGHYWLTSATYSNAHWVEIDLSDPSASTYATVIDSGNVTIPATIGATGADWSWIDGALYQLGTGTDGTTAHLLKWTPGDSVYTDLGAMPFEVTLGSGGSFGATYSDGTYLYGQDNLSGKIYRVDPETGDSILTGTGPTTSGNDGARCSDAPIPTITVTKSVDGRVSADDQFTVGLSNSDGDQLTSATTTGTDTSASTADWPVSQGSTYTITDAMADGSASTIDRYTATVSCVDGDGNTADTGGDPLAWTLDVADATAYACTVTNTPTFYDFGDAPDSYGTTLDNDGARHLIPGYDPDEHTAPVMLGDHIDAETDGQPGANADGDDTNGVDDEDGVTFNADLGYSQPAVLTGVDPNSLQPLENTLTVNASADGFVSVWVDWNQDGDFDDAGELVANAEAVTAGNNEVTFTQQDNTDDIYTYARVRYSTDADAIASPTGSAPDGEVEDYQVLVQRMMTPGTCTVRDVPYYAFTFSTPVDRTGDGGVGSSARYENVSVIDGVPVDMLVEVVAGSTNGGTKPPNGFGVGGGSIFGTDDASWQIINDATIEYTFVRAGTATPVDVNAVFTVNDMDSGEIATFDAADLADYAVTDGSTVTVDDDGSDIVFAGHGNNDGNPASRFQIVLEGISTLEAHWQGGSNSGFGFDGDGDLAITPACSDFGDAPDSYGTTLDNDGARATVIPGLTLGSLIDIDPDGQPTAAADGDDTNGIADEDGVSDPIVIQAGVPTDVPVAVTNDTDDQATLVGWIDFDGNGTFDPGEISALVNIPANAGSDTYTVSWPGQATSGDPTYARFRLFAGAVADPSPTGDWPDGGEVEDYLVQARALQITKTSNATDATRVGDTVHYTVTATNVGGADFTADNPAEVTDDLTGVLDDASFDGAVTVTGSDVDATYSEPQISWSGPLESGDSVTLEYDVVLNKSGDQDVANVAFQPPPCDTDDCEPPTPPDPADCDANNGIDPATGLACDGTDLLLPKLTVTKSSDDLGTAQLGDAVQYSITATNTGKADYTADGPATMVDDLGALLDDATYNGDAAIVDDGPGSVSYSEPQITWTGALGVGDSVTVTYSVTVTNADELENVVFEWPTCTGDDCPPPTPPETCTDGTDPATGLSCDDVSGGIPELEITKASPEMADARIGDTVTWTVTATNVGTRDYTADAPAALVDDLTGVLDDATFDADSITTEGTDVDAIYTEPQIGWAGPLAQGDTVTIAYSAVLTGAGDGHVDNVAWQLPPGPNPPCDLGSCAPPDPADCAATGTDPDTGLPCVDVQRPLPRPQITKSSPDLATAHIGDAVTYTVTFTNAGPGDYTATRPAQFADDLSGVLDDATFDGSVTTKGSDVQATYTEPQIVWAGPLAAGDTVTLTYQVTLTGAGDLDATNVAYVPPPPPVCDADDAADCPPPPTPTPPDPSDCTDGLDSTTGLPCVPVTEKLPKLELAKSSPDLESAHIGDTVTYTVTAKSVGARDFTADDPALVLDDLTGVLDDATFDGTVTVDGSDIDAAYSEPQITWSGPLAVGDTVTLTYTVQLTGDGDQHVDNVVFVPPSPPTGCGDDCPPYDPPPPDVDNCVDRVDSTTGLPCVPVNQDLPKLELGKTSPNLAAASIGDDVTFTVTATNVGARDFTADDPALVLDDLTGVLDDATFDGKVAVDGSKVRASYSEPRITWSGPLAVGDTVTLTYTVQLTGDGDMTVTNVAFVPPSPPTGCGDECPPYDPPTPPASDCAANKNVDPATGLPCVPVSQDLRELQITKSSDAAGIVRNGDVVTYTVTATNVGPGDFTDDDPAVVVDDLTGVLDDATYGDDAAADADGTLDYTAPQVSWVGALASGRSVTITYTVTVTGQGDLGMLNMAFAPPPLDRECAATGTCPPPDADDCIDGADTATGQPCTKTETPLPGLYVTKQVDKTSATGGDVLSFTVTMTNTGRVDFTTSDPAVLTDDLTGVLDDAGYNGDVAADRDGELSYASQTLTWSGALPVDATVTMTYSVTVSKQAIGDDRIDNIASLPDDITPHYPNGQCPDGTAQCDPPSPQAITVSDIHRDAPPAGSLPNTGTDTLGQLRAAGLLLLFGLALLFADQRRRRRGHNPA